MRSQSRSISAIAGAAAILALLVASPAHAQLNGENLLGDNGVKSGTQPAPGFYVGTLYYGYKTDTIKGPDGSIVNPDPSRSGSQTINSLVPLITYVSKAKILGANFGVMAVVPFGAGSLEAPALGLDQQVSMGPSDIYVVPAQLGWHLKRADAIAAFAFFAPTGRYSAGADDNVGKGMWSYEVSGGGTVYLDEARTISIATTAYWETHTKKDGTAGMHIGSVPLSGVKVGQLMTLEGGAGKSFKQGALSVGMAYYAQWKITDDQFGVPAGVPLPSIPRHRVFGLGPDVTIPIASKSTLISLVNVRYLREVGAEVKTQGQSLVVTASFPVPSISIGRH